jgi:predicted DNA-binding mobile mystery protein A
MLLHPERALWAVRNPAGGWLRTLRQALGLSLKSISGKMGVSPQAVHQLEKSEAAGTISLKQLDAAAAAMGCSVVYAVVPRKGSISELANLAGASASKAAAP